jgi:CoA-transferase family III
MCVPPDIARIRQAREAAPRSSDIRDSEKLARLGYGVAERRALSPGLLDVCLNADAWSGPWATRRGFDSLLQMSSGIADAGMRWKNADKPVPLPVQALDHVTGYLMAAAAIHGLKRRFEHGQGMEARLSLAWTAKLLTDAGHAEPGQPFVPESVDDLSPAIEAAQWGPARRLLRRSRCTGRALRPP